MVGVQKWQLCAVKAVLKSNLVLLSTKGSFTFYVTCCVYFGFHLDNRSQTTLFGGRSGQRQGTI